LGAINLGPDVSQIIAARDPENNITRFIVYNKHSNYFYEIIAQTYMTL